MTFRRAAIALLIYVALAVWLTWPLLPMAPTHIAGDPLDPLLNATVLYWNAVKLPLTEAWWNAPFFYPTHAVTTFTENLLGISPFASPLLWITGNPLLAYNVSLFLGWPLSAWATYLLVQRLTHRHDAAFVGGLIFGFTPYRAAELGHIQMVSTYWLPLILLGLHGYLDTRRTRWLALFAGAWLLQALANGYMMLFTCVLIGAWVLYFCTTRDQWRRIPAIAAAFVLALMPVAFVMFRYVGVHKLEGLARPTAEPAGFSYPLAVWYSVSTTVDFWQQFLPYGPDTQFPGAAGPILVVAGTIGAALALARREARASMLSIHVRTALAAIAVLGGIAVVFLYGHGPWHGSLADFKLRMTDATRPLYIALGSAALFTWFTPWLRGAIARRSRLFFYTSATALFGVLACGRALITADRSIVLYPAPYEYLMTVPGFTAVRVPARFWMIGVLCLGVSAGLALPYSESLLRRRRLVIVPLAIAVAIVDGKTTMPMSPAPALIANAEPAWRRVPFLELPIGLGFDYTPGYRAARIGRQSFNGASGFEPSHYAPMMDGLQGHDPEMLQALAVLGPFDAVVDLSVEPDGQQYYEYVRSFPGARQIVRSATVATFEIPQMPPLASDVGAPWPIAGVRTNDGDESRLIDGDQTRYWAHGPQAPGQFVIADLQQLRDVGGVTQTLGDAARDYPRHLVIETSVDGVTWEPAWEGNGAARAFYTAARAPKDAAVAVAFSPRPARFVRLRQTASHINLWRINELTIHAPK